MKRLLVALFCLTAFQSAGAVVSIYSGTSKVNFESDSTAYPCRPVLNVFDNSNADTARMALRGSTELRWPYAFKDSLGVTQLDSCACLVKLLVAGYDPTYNPSADVQWFFAGGAPPKRAPVAWGPPEIVRRVDSIFAGGGSGGGGACDSSGPYPDSILVLRCSDSVSLGAGVSVRLIPNNGGDPLDAETDANGWATFSVAADTYFVYSWATGYYQAVVPDTNRVPAISVRDTLLLCAVSSPSSPAPALTPVTFRLFDGTGDSLQSGVLYYKLDIGSSITAWSYDSTKIFDPAEIKTAGTNAAGIVTVYVVPNDSIYTDAYETQKTRWIFWARSPKNGDHLLGKDGVKVYVPASQTALVWPRDF